MKFVVYVNVVPYFDALSLCCRSTMEMIIMEQGLLAELMNFKIQYVHSNWSPIRTVVCSCIVCWSFTLDVFLQVYGMLSQMDPALVAFCDKIAAEGGPVSVPDELAGDALPQNPILQSATMTRARARLRNVQPEVNLDQSYEALRRHKKHADSAQMGNSFCIC